MITGKQVWKISICCRWVTISYTIWFLPDKRLLKPSAVPSLNLSLRKLTESEMNENLPTTGRERYHTASFPDSREESRKRFSNIIVVDLIKDSKKSKHVEKPKVSRLMAIETILNHLQFSLFLIDTCRECWLSALLGNEERSPWPWISIDYDEKRARRAKEAGRELKRTAARVLIPWYCTISPQMEHQNIRRSLV